MKTRRLLLLSLASFTLAACASQGIDPSVINAVNTYYPESVTVSRTNSFSAGLEAIGKESNDQLAEQFVTDSQIALSAELPNIMKGTKPAKILVLLETASIASEAGRVLLASDSNVAGTVSIVDAATGSIMSTVKVYAADKGQNHSINIGGLPVGALMNLAANAKSSSKKERFARITRAFIEDVKKKLRTK